MRNVMESIPLVSVCVPVYNAAPYLRECIDSILAQSFADFELLLADDGSTDDSRAIIRSYADPRVRLIEREHDYIATLNALLDAARGKYVARMDADDRMLKDRLRTQVDYMEATPRSTSWAVVCFISVSNQVFICPMWSGARCAWRTSLKRMCFTTPRS